MLSSKAFCRCHSIRFATQTRLLSISTFFATQTRVLLPKRVLLSLPNAFCYPDAFCYPHQTRLDAHSVILVFFEPWLFLDSICWCHSILQLDLLIPCYSKNAFCCHVCHCMQFPSILFRYYASSLPAFFAIGISTYKSPLKICSLSSVLILDIIWMVMVYLGELL